MIYKLVIITLLSLLLTACGKNDDIVSEKQNQPNDNNSYARLNYSNDSLYDYDNTPKVISGNKEDLSNRKEDEEAKDYIANDFENGKLLNNNETQDNNKLASFTTPILTTDPNRYHNITIVRDRLNGYVLQNDEVFSFNKVCGPYGKDDGFKEATILLSNGKSDKGYGGGVCQLSTTLYNAVKNLNIDITERHHHSVPVAYVKGNEDATVSLQSNLDFKFKNTSGKPLTFKTTSTEKSLTVSVYAQ